MRKIVRISIFIRGSNLKVHFCTLLSYCLFGRWWTRLWMPWITFSCVRLGLQLLECLWWMFLVKI